MLQNNIAENELGTEPIGKLLARFAVPSMISLLVNSLYNIVDQIFIGHGVGYLGNGATNVAFPFVSLTLALALLISDGCAANMSLKLGGQDRRGAEESFGNALTLSVLGGVALMLVGLVFLRPLLLLFGATAGVLPYAIQYTRIILLGIPFLVMSITMSAMIRVDGSPRYAMVAMLTGAVINVILDPIFIFVCRWGVAGAAFATILGQFVNFLISLFYLKRLKHISFFGANLRLRLQTVKRILGLGISSFFNQVSLVVVQIVINNTVIHYGALSMYGADIPLTCFGIVMKVNQIIISLIIGIASGAQPIIGYNYGAKKYDRVKHVYRLAVTAASVFAVIGFLVFQLFPQYVVAMFGQENALYNQFAIKCFRCVLLCLFVVGFQMVSSLFFQAIGKPSRAILLSLSRQILFLVPLLLILPLIWGLDGALFAMPIADALSTLLAAVFITWEMRKLQDAEQEML